MHYRNGREAKNGDKIIQIGGYGSSANVTAVGVLYDAQPGSDHCNGSIAPIQNTPTGACLCDCLHVDDLAELLKEKGLDKRPAGKVTQPVKYIATIALALLCCHATAQDASYRPTPHLHDGYWEEIYSGTGWCWWTWPGCKNSKGDRPSKGIKIIEPTLTAEGYFGQLPKGVPRYMPPRGTAIDDRGRVVPPRPIPGTVPWNL